LRDLGELGERGRERGVRRGPPVSEVVLTGGYASRRACGVLELELEEGR